jgi:hypothetical protein
MPMEVTADVPPPELRPEDLVPEAADVTGRWFAFTEDGVMVLVAWVERGPDPFSLPQGYAIWRRHDSTPYWRADLVERHGAEEGIQEIQISTADVTGDGSDDALVFEGVGGSGACAVWSVIDLTGLVETYRRDVCDGRIEPGPPGSPGLILTESVYRAGDAHCCPSAMRRITLTWDGTAWRVTDRTVIEA